MDTIDGWRDRAISEISKLRGENAALQDRLDDSVAKIMKLEGEVEQITDGALKKRFEDLYRSIQDWVAEIELGLMRNSLDFRVIFQNILHDNKGKLLLWHLGLLEGQNDEARNPTWDRNSKDLGNMKWLGERDTCMNVVLCRLLWCRLHDRIFSKWYPLGLHDTAMKGFDYMVDAMKGDRYGTATKESTLRAAKWRSKAIATLLPTKKFSEEKKSQMENFRRSLWQEFTTSPISLSAEVVKRHFGALDIKVLVPATRLQELIACSPVKYEFKDLKDLPQQTVPGDSRLFDYNLKDIVKWRDSDPSETFAGIYFCLFPGIYQVIEQEEDLLLLKPLVLVYDSEVGQQLHKYIQMRDLRQSKRQKSPTKSEKSLPPSPVSSPRFPPKKSLEERKGSSHRARREDQLSESSSSGGTSGNIVSAPKSRNSRRRSEDKSSKETPSNELKEKVKGLRRAETEPVPSSLSHRSASSPRHQRTAATPSTSLELSAHQGSRFTPNERKRNIMEDDITPTGTSMNLSSTSSHRSHDSQSQSEDGSGDDLTESHSSEYTEGDDGEEDSMGYRPYGSVIRHRGMPLAVSSLTREVGVDLCSPDL